jgi:hypothetical protein
MNLLKRLPWHLIDPAHREEGLKKNKIKCYMKSINSTKLTAFVLILVSLFFSGCKEDDDPAATTTDTIADVYKKIYGSTDMYIDGNFLVVKSKGTPDHKSPYYTGSNFEAYNGTNANFAINPNKISEQAFTFRIPLKPAISSTHTATPLGPIGISINGVPFYNQYAGPNQPLTSEINSFDQYNGHPQQSGQYHYHVEPLYLTTKKGKTALLGFLLDGFPVYGPTENGTTVLTISLDVYHGHTSATTDFPDGIYHYHVTSDSPYINGGGFYGTAGTVSN